MIGSTNNARREIVVVTVIDDCRALPHYFEMIILTVSLSQDTHGCPSLLVRAKHHSCKFEPHDKHSCVDGSMAGGNCDDAAECV